MKVLGITSIIAFCLAVAGCASAPPQMSEISNLPNMSCTELAREESLADAWKEKYAKAGEEGFGTAVFAVFSGLVGAGLQQRGDYAGAQQMIDNVGKVSDMNKQQREHSEELSERRRLISEYRTVRRCD